METDRLFTLMEDPPASMGGLLVSLEGPATFMGDLLEGDPPSSLGDLLVLLEDPPSSAGGLLIS